MNNNKNYKVSIILPAFNTINYIRRCLASIPIRDDVEVFMIDDHSTDGTGIELLNYSRTNPNAKFIQNKENIGVARSRNIAYGLCTGEYITQLDSDDYYFTDVFNSIIDNDLTGDIVYFDLQVNNGDIWRCTPKTRYTLMDHVYLVKRDLLSNHRHPDLPYGSGVELNNAIQKDLDERNGTTVYTHKVAYMYNFPREGSILNLKHRGLL